MRLTRSAASLALLTWITGCASPGAITPVSDGLAAQGVPTQLAGEWVGDHWGQTWLQVDWEALRAELLHPDASDAAVQLDCEELGLSEIAYVPGACAVPGTPDPDTLIAQGRLDEVVWATGFLEPLTASVAVHHASWTPGGLRPTRVSAQGTATWAAVACPGGDTATLAWGRQPDRLVLAPSVGPSRSAGARVTDRTARQGLGESLRTRGLSVRGDGIAWTGQVRSSWTETPAHWTTPTGLVGDADTVRLAHGEWSELSLGVCGPG